MYIVNHKEGYFGDHCTELFSLLKVASSQAKIYENFANYFLKTKAKNKFLYSECTCTYQRRQCFIVHLHVNGYRKAQWS